MGCNLYVQSSLLYRCCYCHYCAVKHNTLTLPFALETLDWQHQIKHVQQNRLCLIPHALNTNKQKHIKDYYQDVRKAICQYIENFTGKLNAVLKNVHDVKSGCEYIEKSGMCKNTTWATEIEILATTKCFRHDIFTYYNY